MPVPTADQIVQKWQQRAASASAKQAYIDGTQGITESPMAKAADNAQKLLSRVEQSITSGRYAAKMRSIPLDVYKAATRAKADRYSSGITAGTEKMRSAMQKWAPVYQQQHDSAKSMVNDGSTESQVAIVARVIDMAKQAAGRA